jgi:hypothetical protein
MKLAALIVSAALGACSAQSCRGSEASGTREADPARAATARVAVASIAVPPLPLSAVAATGFEGVVRIEGETAGKREGSTLEIAGRRMRADFDGATAYQLADLDLWELTVVHPELRAAVVGNRAALVASSGPARIEPLGVTRVVAGRNCEVFRVTGVQRAELCVDRTLPGFVPFAAVSGHRSAIELAGGPLPLELRSLPGGPARTYRVTKVEARRVPRERLVIPQGYSVRMAQNDGRDDATNR